MAETPQDTEPISPAVPLIQPMFKKGVHGMLCPVAVAFYAREGYQNTNFWIGSTSQQRGLAQQNQQSQSRIHQNSWYDPSGIAGLIDLEWV